MSEQTTKHATFELERVYEGVPTARVWAAWANAEEKRRWWGPGTLTADNHDLNFSVGGLEHVTDEAPDGTRYTLEARYCDIVEGERFVYTYEMSCNGDRMSVSVATVVLAPEGDGTLLTLTEQGVFLDGVDKPADREHGTRAILESLAAALAQVEA
jgi:uncharacterized protein YndB with AHSA1/START domain